MSIAWVRTLTTISGILTFLVLLAGLIIIALSYFRKGKTRAALLGAIGFLIMFLFSCCSLSWGFLDTPIAGQLPMRSVIVYRTLQAILLFLGALINLVGLGLVIAAVVSASRRQ